MKIINTRAKLKYFLKQNGIAYKPSYCLDEKMLVSFTAPKHIMEKFQEMTKKYKMTKGEILTLLINNIELENNHE